MMILKKPATMQRAFFLIQFMNSIEFRVPRSLTERWYSVTSKK